MTCSFRFATQQDMGFIYDSLRNMAEENGMLARFNHTVASLEKAIFKDQMAEVLLAYREDAPVGVALFSVTHRNFTVFDKPGLYLHDIYVTPAYRRQGVATQLKEYLKELAKSRGLNRIDFVVLKDNASAIQVYDTWSDTKEVDYIKYMRVAIDG